jgi:pentatricopeptide repeat protein
LQNIAERLNDDNLRPSMSFYTNLMLAHVLRRQPGFASDVNAVFDQLKSDKKNSKQPENEREYLEYLAIDDLVKSGDPQPPKQAQQIFDVIKEPDTAVYNSLLNTYARDGKFDKAIHLYQQMQSDFESGENKNCCPTLQTYNIILNALQKSNRSDAAEVAEQIFNAIPMPNTVTFNTLIYLYAERGMAAEALSLTRRMQSDFVSIKNLSCLPNEVTKHTLLKALRSVNDQELQKEAKDVLRWFIQRGIGR